MEHNFNIMFKQREKTRAGRVRELEFNKEVTRFSKQDFS